MVKTTTPITAENLVTYKDMIDSNQLVKIVFGPSTAKGIRFTPTEENPEPPVEVPKGTYAFSSRFVREHFRFAKNSLVYMDTCWSAHRDAREFREACFDRGASVYLGWDNSIHYNAAETLNRELFDASNAVIERAEGPSGMVRQLQADSSRDAPATRVYDSAADRSGGEQLQLVTPSWLHRPKYVHVEMVERADMHPHWSRHLLVGAPPLPFVIVAE